MNISITHYFSGEQDHCNGKLVDMDSRLRVYSFEEVKTKNAAGFCWLILDGDPTSLLA